MALRRVRLVLVVVTLVLLETTVFHHLRIFGVMPSLCLVATAAIAYEEGPQSGVLFGFASGLALDLFLPTPAGLSALAFAITGYTLGVLQGGFVRESPAMAPLLGVAAGLIGTTAFVIVGGIAGEAGFFTFHSVKVIILNAIYDAPVAFLVFPFVHWANHDADRARRWR